MLEKIYINPELRILTDINFWTNRISFPLARVVVDQNKRTRGWRCSCKTYAANYNYGPRDCQHLRALNIPPGGQPYEVAGIEIVPNEMKLQMLQIRQRARLVERGLLKDDDDEKHFPPVNQDIRKLTR